MVNDLFEVPYYTGHSRVLQQMQLVMLCMYVWGSSQAWSILSTPITSHNTYAQYTTSFCTASDIVRAIVGDIARRRDSNSLLNLCSEILNTSSREPCLRPLNWLTRNIVYKRERISSAYNNASKSHCQVQTESCSKLTISNITGA